MSLLLFLLSLASCASKAPGAGEVDTLTSQSKFVFRGTVQKNNDATMPETVTTARTVVVKVQEVLRSPEVIGDFSGREIVVQLREGAPAKPGQQLVFFANGWVYGRSLAVIEVGRTRVPDNAAGLGQLVAVAVQKEEDKKVQARIDLAALVIAGKVSDVRPAPRQEQPEPVSEHSPDWQQAVVEVASVEKGQYSQKTLVVLFPASTDEFWYESPKFRPGQEGIFILQKDQQEKGAPRMRRPGYTALDALDFQPLGQLDRIRAMIKRLL